METNYRLERWIAVLLGLLFFLPFVAHADELLPSGAFHGNEVRAKSGDHYLAIMVNDASSVLQPVKIRVERVFDPIVDADDETSGKDVTAIGVPKHVYPLLVRGASLHSGPVTLAHPSSLLLPTNATTRLTLGTIRSELDFRCGPTDPDGMKRCSILLTTGGVSQELTRLTVFDNLEPTLLFAGDLDRDGKLDLVIDTTDDYSVWRPTLYLSGAAREGELVAQTAQFTSAGC